MPLTESERTTIRSYDQNAQEWAGQHPTPGYWKKELETFKRYLPKGKVIEIGIGGGRDANDLIAAGYDYVGTDVSVGFLGVAKQNLQDPKLVNCDLYHLPFADNTFDGFWISATLLHIPRANISFALWSLHDVVIDRGIGFISIKQGDGEVFESKVLPSGSTLVRNFTYWQDWDFQQNLLWSDFDILESGRKEDGNIVWLTYIVRPLK